VISALLVLVLTVRGQIDLAPNINCAILHPAKAVISWDAIKPESEVALERRVVHGGVGQVPEDPNREVFGHLDASQTVLECVSGVHDGGGRSVASEFVGNNPGFSFGRENLKVPSIASTSVLAGKVEVQPLVLLIGKNLNTVQRDNRAFGLNRMVASAISLLSVPVSLRFGKPISFFGRIEGRVNEADADNAHEHADNRSDAHGPRPSRRDQLGLKIILLALSVSGFVVLSVDAFKSFRRRDTGAAALSMFSGGLAVCFGVLASLAIIEGL